MVYIGLTRKIDPITNQSRPDNESTPLIVQLTWSWTLQYIAIANIVLCMAFKGGVGGASYIVQ